MSFAYDPYLPPILRSIRAADTLPELLEIARTRPLTEDKTQLLAEAFVPRAMAGVGGKAGEESGFEVDPVALHIHERVSAQAILRVAAAGRVQRRSSPIRSRSTARPSSSTSTTSTGRTA